MTTATPRRGWRSAVALLLGILTGALLSLGTDQLLHLVHVYPPWGQPMNQPGLNLLALFYRLVYNVVGGYVIARFAPYAPMRHALAGGIVGFVLSLAGVIAATQLDLGPLWYPIALAVTAIPCSWLGGRLFLIYSGQRPQRLGP
jgi:hypothetical protein